MRWRRLLPNCDLAAALIVGVMYILALQNSPRSIPSGGWQEIIVITGVIVGIIYGLYIAYVITDEICNRFWSTSK